ncbi:ABC-type methionine transport system, permease component [Arboricoccus pini]|uniref:ABC-type methionine transport system, permease component n=1 Tax=Arboricoccus pini TaxID=1963835 RepID=A0A212RFR2_9PROT|nr:methionine ABC transporter permease [Arboricoccus pini]SNB71211.1 ABC-type methionine transport system, permease component [Arboricoccus pini]
MSAAETFGREAATTLPGTPWSKLPELLVPAFGETVVMVGVVMIIVFALGLPLGVIAHNTSPGGLFPRPRLHAALNAVISLGRSLPFLVLMAAIIPFTLLITGTTIGIPAAIVPMVVAGTPFFARLVENALREVPPAITDLARASGGSDLQVIAHAQIAEAWPAIIGSMTVNTIAMIEYSAIAGTIGAGGIGYVAVTYGYQRFDHTVMIATMLILIATVAVVQAVGDYCVRRARRR